MQPAIMKSNNSYQLLIAKAKIPSEQIPCVTSLDVAHVHTTPDTSHSPEETLNPLLR